MQQDGRLIHDNFPEDWARYDFTEVVFKPKLMTAKKLKESIYSAWETLYNEKQLKRKFIDALKTTKNAISATWSYNSNLQYHNLVYEHKKDRAVQDINL